MKEVDDWDDVDICDDYECMHHAAVKPCSSFRVFRQSDVEMQRQNTIERIADSLSIDYDDAEELLCQFRWRPAKLLNDYLENEKTSKSSSLCPAPGDGIVECGTAFCGKYPRSETISLSCGHIFCLDCFQSTISSAMSSGRIAIYARCPGLDYSSGSMKKCQLKIPSRVFMQFLEESQNAKYQRWLVDEFVDGSETLKWCIRPSCDRIISCTNPNEIVTCLCKTTFCFGCSIPDHRPAPCDLARKWIGRATSDSETEKWIKSRTKQCPKCSIPIEKNRACNHMICSNCSHHFCWLCKQSWSNHDVEQFGFYRCNVYEAKEEEFSQDPENIQAVKANQQMQKYTFYHNRHVHQIQAGQEIINLRSQIEADDVQWIFNVERVLPVLSYLIQARRFLAWSYCFAYYLQAGPYKQLAEHQQGILESITEKLQSALTLSKPKPKPSTNTRRRRDGPISKPQKNQPTENEIIRLGAAVHHFSTQLLSQLSGDNVNALSEADEHMDRWACTVCTSELYNSDGYCTVCGACRMHSEQECRIPNCKNPRTPEVLLPGQVLAAVVQPGQD